VQTRHRETNCGYDGKRLRYQRYIACVGNLNGQSDEYTKKKEELISKVNHRFIESINARELSVEVILYENYDKSAEAELDELWSFVQNKDNQRWLWLAIDHDSHTILAYTFGQRKDVVFRELKVLLEPFGITMFYTDDWGAYERNISPKNHTVGKANTQAIERQNLTLRTRIKRLARKTICFSKSVKMHDIVIGLVINILAFGLYFANHFHAFYT
jgi:insertion element IS1 protein InsB